VSPGLSLLERRLLSLFAFETSVATYLHDRLILERENDIIMLRANKALACFTALGPIDDPMSTP
jgi:hypothetical protein